MFEYVDSYFTFSYMSYKYIFFPICKFIGLQLERLPTKLEGR